MEEETSRNLGERDEETLRRLEGSRGNAGLFKHDSNRIDGSRFTLCDPWEKVIDEGLIGGIGEFPVYATLR